MISEITVSTLNNYELLNYVVWNLRQVSIELRYFYVCLFILTAVDIKFPVVYYNILRAGLYIDYHCGGCHDTSIMFA